MCSTWPIRQHGNIGSSARDTKSPSINFRFFCDIAGFAKISGHIVWITFLFGKRHRRYAVPTHAKSDRDIWNR